MYPVVFFSLIERVSIDGSCSYSGCLRTIVDWLFVFERPALVALLDLSLHFSS